MTKTKLLVLALACMTAGGYSSAIDISLCAQLLNVNNDLNTGYTLTQDIDCSGLGNDIMIGSMLAPFRGTFDGSGHTITVDINSTEGYVGLFRATNGATISNLTVSGSVVSTFNQFLEDEGDVGAVVGYANNTTLNGVHAKGTVAGLLSNIGGLIGNAQNGTIVQNSSSSASINASGAVGGNIGGLIGNALVTTISGSYAVGNVHGTLRVGGLVGLGVNNTVTQSYARGDVDADYSAGGLFGRTFGTNITNAYAHGHVHVRDGEAAGLIGFVDSTSITNSYAIGNITGSTYDFGGLVAHSQGGSNSATASFWDTGTSGMPTSIFGEGKSTPQMKNISTFSGWDFDTIWAISGALNGGYPYFQYQTFAPSDTTAPDTFILSATSDALDSSTATFEFDANEQPSTFECAIDDGIVLEDFHPCTSPYTISSLTVGTYSFYVRARDAAGNADASPASITWTVSNLHVISVSPSNGTTNVAVNSPIVVRFSEPISDEVGVYIGSGPCDGSGGICPQLNPVLSSGNTVITYTRADENFHNNTTYTIYIYGSNGLETPALAWWSFTTAAAAHGGGGGGAYIVKDNCADDSSASYYDRSCGDVVSGWKKFFASFSSGAVSTVTDPITVKAFVTDVFTLLHITKPIHRQSDSDTKTVPEKLVTTVIQILRRLLHK